MHHAPVEEWKHLQGLVKLSLSLCEHVLRFGVQIDGRYSIYERPHPLPSLPGLHALGRADDNLEIQRHGPLTDTALRRRRKPP